MTATPTKLSRNLIEQILHSVGKGGTGIGDDVETQDYDWSVPHNFSDEQMPRLMDIAGSIAGFAAEALGRFLRRELEITAESLCERFGMGVSEEVEAYYVGLEDENESCGAICVPVRTAAKWVRQLLGDSGQDEEAEVALSQLEESLLVDAVSIFAEAVRQSHPSLSNVKAGTRMVREPGMLKVDETDEMCSMALKVKSSDESEKTWIIINAAKLSRISDGDTAESTPVAPEAAAQAMREHVYSMDVCVNAILGSTSLTFGELADLKEHDVVLLDTTVTDSVDVAAEGKSLFTGTPAKSTGKYAVVISELKDRKEQ